MALTVGTRLGSYEIVVQLGAGGMGEVYRARDPRLGRDVAIKILPESFTHDLERVARFRREAQILASLNHPNIATIHGLEEVGDQQFLVLELVDGETLDKRIARGALAIEEALAIARQIVEGLEAAHEKGIIHRDLKPANIALTANDQVKVLDFGLAKLAEPAGRPSSDPSASPTMTSPAMMTGVGVILGTTAYMSPEQARGKSVDKRADIWAFGALVFEMLAGKRLFEGDTVSDTLAAVLRVEPDWTRLPADTPGSVRRLLRRCLAKDRRRRLQDIGDARIELEEDNEATDPRTATRTAQATWRTSHLLGSLALLATGAALALFGTRSWPREDRAAGAEVRRFLLTQAIGVDIDESSNAVVSPDGQNIAMTGIVAGSRAVFIHSLRDGTTRQIPGTTGVAQRPVWSPDGMSLALPIGGRLVRFALDGRSQSLSPLTGPFGGGSWKRNGEILYSSNLQIVAISSSTGESRVVLDADSDRLAWAGPEALPDSTRFLTFKSSASKPDVYFASLDGATARAVMGASATHPAFAPPDHLLALREDQLARWQFDPVDGRVLSEPTILLSGLRVRFGSGTVPYSVSDNGVLVAFEERYSAPTSLSWFDRKGTAMGSLTLPRPCRNPELSPDGTRVAMECFELSGNRDIWLYDLARNAAQRFTTTTSDDADPVWSPDSSRLAFASTQLGAADVFVNGTGGATKEALLVQTEGSTPTMAWSPDGKHIAVLLPGSGFGLIDTDAPGAPSRFLGERTSYTYFEPQFAPNGRFISYSSTESGPSEVFVQPWPPTGEKVQVSVGGGTDARWNPSQNEIFYLNPERKLMSVSVKIAGKKLAPGTPVPLFQTQIAGPLGIGHRFPYAVSRDGQRFLMYVQEEAAMSAITVVLNWPSLLRQ